MPDPERPRRLDRGEFVRRTLIFLGLAAADTGSGCRQGAVLASASS